jgi:hypothetical protein
MKKFKVFSQPAVLGDRQKKLMELARNKESRALIKAELELRSTFVSYSLLFCLVLITISFLIEDTHLTLPLMYLLTASGFGFINLISDISMVCVMNELKIEETEIDKVGLEEWLKGRANYLGWFLWWLFCCFTYSVFAVISAIF